MPAGPLGSRTPDAAVTQDGEPARLGVIDWGIGGLGLVGLLDARLPSLPVVYWSDTGSVPYGLQRPTELAARLGVVVAALVELGCTEVVLACNAASTAVDRLARAAVPVEGIISHGVAAAQRALAEAEDLLGSPYVVGVVGGQGTIRSGRYRRSLAAPGRSVISRVAQPLSAHIEAGRTGQPDFEADLRAIVAPLRGAAAVVLACTHYPAATASFAAALPGTVLVDPAASLADALVARHAPLLPASSPGRRTFLTTGDPRAMRHSAWLAWGHDLPDITPVTLA
ncbi:MAG: Glutamate racemase [Acidimicrobiales bacterium]|nr:Glutamate racemase [Acidimicrobiales bacterium]